MENLHWKMESLLCSSRREKSKKNKQLKRSQLLHRKISLFKKQLTRIKQVIDQSSIKKAFSAFLNNFFYVQPTLVFHAQEGCCIVCNFDAFFKKI